jgi:hypothetical protein
MQNSGGRLPHDNAIACALWCHCGLYMPQRARLRFATRSDILWPKTMAKYEWFEQEEAAVELVKAIRYFLGNRRTMLPITRTTLKRAKLILGTKLRYTKEGLPYWQLPTKGLDERLERAGVKVVV